MKKKKKKIFLIGKVWKTRDRRETNQNGIHEKMIKKVFSSFLPQNIIMR
jgi:hypothetical protein